VWNTAVLTLVYFGRVAVTEAVFRVFTEHEEQPQLVVVVTALVIAALVNPFRRRIQSLIDRRFYRSKYDARKTLVAFSVTLREEPDLDALNADKGDDAAGPRLTIAAPRYATKG
jgi:hypothetical protein